MLKEYGNTYLLNVYSVLAGDRFGVRYKFTYGRGNLARRPEQVNKPLEVFSAGKWVGAAALGAGVMHGYFRWKDPVHRYIGWWNGGRDNHEWLDGRSKITFEHLVSHQSGVVAASHPPDEAVANLQWFFLLSDIGYHNESLALEETCKLIHQHTPWTIHPPEVYRYGETHWPIAQFAAMNAYGTDMWQTYLYDLWGERLGLKIAKVHKNYNAELHATYFENSETSWALDDRGYGFYQIDRETTYLQNPFQGNQLIASPCTFARFLKNYVMQGDTMYGAYYLDAVHAENTLSEGNAGKYCLGHWKHDGVTPHVWHSFNAYGTVPAMSTMFNGEHFWAYVSSYSPTWGTYSALGFVTSVMPQISAFFSTKMPKLLKKRQLGCYLDPVSSTSRRRGWR